MGNAHVRVGDDREKNRAVVSGLAVRGILTRTFKRTLLNNRANMRQISAAFAWRINSDLESYPRPLDLT